MCSRKFLSFNGWWVEPGYVSHHSVLQNLDPKSMARSHQKFLTGFDSCCCWSVLKQSSAAWKRILLHSQSAPPRDAACDMNVTSAIRAKPCCKPHILGIKPQGTVWGLPTRCWSPKCADLLLACAYDLRSTAQETLCWPLISLGCAGPSTDEAVPRTASELSSSDAQVYL